MDMRAKNPIDREKLLSLMNWDIPKGVDWKKGARTYVANCVSKQGRQNVEFQSMNKPLLAVGEHDPHPAIAEIVHYLNTFSNAISLVQPAFGARILDVACGGGWVSHYLSTMGYWTYGIDISEDFIGLAKQRLSSDLHLGVSASEAEDRFSILDIEAERMPEHLRGTFDFIWLESCLHHFVDPISALEHLGEALKPDGVLILIEFENRVGGIKPEYMRVMNDYDTLERPYARHELTAALGMAGFSEHQFVGTVNGWFAPENPATAHLGQHAVESANMMNVAICAKEDGRLDRYFPSRTQKKKKERLEFSTGFYEDEGDRRWSGPSSEIQIFEDIESLELTIHGSPEQRQTLVIYGDKGEKARVDLHPLQPLILQLRDLKAGEVLHFVSNHAFSPKWAGSKDGRLLSFYIPKEAIERPPAKRRWFDRR